MSLNILEYDELLRIRSATESLARNSSNSVSLDRYLHLDGICRQLGAIARQREDQRDYWKRQCEATAASRDAFAAWGDGVLQQLEAMEQRALAAEAELAALKASLAPSGQG